MLNKIGLSGEHCTSPRDKMTNRLVGSPTVVVVMGCRVNEIIADTWLGWSLSQRV